MASVDARVLIIGDSNMCQAAHIPILPDWEIHALVGAKFQHIFNVLQKFFPSPKLGKFFPIIAVGTNHRDHSPMVYADIVKTINEHLQSVGVKYAFVGVSAPSTVNTLQGENILKLNRMLKSVSGGKTYVRPLPSEEVVTIDGIHHVRPVVTKVVETVHQCVDVAAGYTSASSNNPPSPSTSDNEAVTDGTTIDDNDWVHRCPKKASAQQGKRSRLTGRPRSVHPACQQATSQRRYAKPDE